MRAFIAALLVALAIVGASVASANTCHASDITSQRIIELTNQNRTAPVVEDLLLDKAAQAKANDMASKGYFAHSYQARTGWDFMRQHNYQYYFVGENLAVDFKSSKALMKAWMNSPSHRANIINPRFNRIGIGIAEGRFQGEKTMFVVQFFSN